MHHDIQKNISYHNFYLFFPICKIKEFKLFQLLESFKKKCADAPSRHVPKSKNLGGDVVMRRAAACRRRLLICQNLGGHMPDEGLKAFKCKLCDKSFSRKDKMTTHTVSNYEGLKAFRWKCVTKAFLKIVTWLEICHQLMKERKKNLKLLSRITWTSYEANTTFILKKLFSENNWINTSISWITLSTVKYVMNDFLTKIHFFNKLHQFMKAQNMPGNKNQSFIVNNRAKIVYFKVFK